VGLSSGLSIPAFEIGGVEYNYETGKLLFSNIQAEYQYRVKDWLGVWGAFGLTARLGTETKSLVTQGVTVANGFDLGWKLRCYQSDNMLLTTTLRVHKSSFTAVDLIGFIDGIVEGVPESENQLVFTVPLLIGSTGFQYSWAVNQLIGVTASVGLGYGDSPDRRAENQWYFHAGGMLDFDLRRRLRVPLGVAAGMMFSDLPDQDSKLDGTVSSSVFRIDYIGRIDFNLGLEVTSQWYDITTMSESLRFTTATMDFRYYF
jgi:hypothetical protein